MPEWLILPLIIIGYIVLMVLVQTDTYKQAEASSVLISNCQYYIPQMKIVSTTFASR